MPRNNLGGNVMEHVLDYYYAYVDTGSVVVDPVGPMTGNEIILRGSAYEALLGSVGLTAVIRIGHEVDYFTRYIGFRCARRGY